METDECKGGRKWYALVDDFRTLDSDHESAGFTLDLKGRQQSRFTPTLSLDHARLGLPV